MEISKNTEYTLLEDYRYERKYRPERLNYIEVKMIVLGSDAFFRKIYKPRTVNNIYLDSPELECFYANSMVHSERNKFRIRWYGNTIGKISGAVFEVKQKEAYRGIKQSFFLPEFELEKAFNSKFCFNFLKSAGIPEAVMDQISGFEPVMLNSYNREYFRDITGNYRLTIDSRIRYYKINAGFNHYKEFIEDPGIVVELKYSDKYNDYATHIANTLPFRLTRNSKYVDGMLMLYDLNL